jgi:DNA-binding NarL/FixJ family response regulator
MFRRVRIGIAEDQEIFRKGLGELLNKFPHYEVCYGTENGLSLIHEMSGNCPDIAIIDYNLPLLNGIETVKEIKKRFPGVKTLILSMHSEEKIVQNAFENGVNGYLSKDDSFNEIPTAIDQLMKNQFYMNDRYTAVLLQSLKNQKASLNEGAQNETKFNFLELQILDFISQEKTTKEISLLLNKSTRSIEKHKTNMMNKAGVQNSVGLIMFAVKNKIIVL